MSYELNFYGITIHVFFREGHVYLLRRDVAALFDVDNTDEMMDPFLPYVKEDMISLAAVQWEMPTMIQHVLGNTTVAAMEKRDNLMDILKEELVENIIKQLTYDKHVLPLIKMPQELSSAGITQLDGIMGITSESGFTLRTVGQLLGHQGHVKLPQDVTFYFVLIRDLGWDASIGRSVQKTSLQKVIPMYYLDQVLKHNAAGRGLINPFLVPNSESDLVKVLLSEE